MKRIIILALIFVATVFVGRFLFGGNEDTWPCDKEKGEWIRHGNPSAAKPASECGQTKNQDQVQEQAQALSEECKSSFGKSLKLAYARGIAQSQCEEGSLKDTYFCNYATGTWWFDFAPKSPKKGCNPACVVDVETEKAEINWRCTGLIPSEQKDSEVTPVISPQGSL